MTPEEKARISRENGAKSSGPTTQEGKDRVSRNALKHGEYSEKFKHFVPPHEACLCIEEREGYDKLVDTLMAIYRPINQSSLDAVGDIAVARWQIRRFEACITMSWNLSLANATHRANNFAPELAEIKVMVDSVAELLSGNSVLIKLNREIARLQQVIARAERRIKFIHSTFPNTPVQTQPDSEPPAENKPLNDELPEQLKELPPPVYTTECTQTAIEGYQKLYPGRPIVILPSKDAQNDVDDASDYRDLPRKVA